MENKRNQVLMKQNIKQNSMILLPIEVKVVEKMLNDLKPKNNTDNFELNYVYLKRLMPSIVPTLTELFQKRFVENYFPESPKLAKIIPFSKKDVIPRHNINDPFRYVLYLENF